MGEGLDVGLDEFKNMSQVDRDAVMFKNIVHIREASRNNQFDKRLQYIWLLCLTGVIGAKRLLGL